MEVHIDEPPNAGIAAVLIGSEMRSACLIYAHRAAALYQARVHKVSGDLAANTRAGTTRILTRYGPRWAGLVTVDSEHFLPHEEGWVEDGDKHAGAHDFNAVLAEMAGLPVPPTVHTPNYIEGADNRGRSSASIRRGERVAQTASFIRQYNDTSVPFEDTRAEGRQQRQKYLDYLKSHPLRNRGRR